MSNLTKFFLIKQKHSKKQKIKIKYANEFIQKMEFSGTTICVYQFIFNKYDSNDTNIIQYFIMTRLVLCINSNVFVAHMFYAWSFNHDTIFPIAINQNNFLFI